MLCMNCFVQGFCLSKRTQIVTNTEIRDPQFVRAVRATARDQCVASRAWVDSLYDWLRDYPGCFVDKRGQRTELEMVHLEYADGAEKEEAPHARWYQDFCNTPCPPDVTPFVRKEAWERVRIIATLLRATYPVRAATWGEVPANDNRPPES